MASIPAIRDALAAQITAQIPSLRAADVVPGTISPPVVVVRPARDTLISYAETFDGGMDLFFEAVVMVGAASDRMSQDLLDAILSPTGPQSVYLAVEADPTLAGTVAWAHVIQARGYGLINWAGTDYLGSTLVVQAAAP